VLLTVKGEVSASEHEHVAKKGKLIGLQLVVVCFEDGNDLLQSDLHQDITEGCPSSDLRKDLQKKLFKADRWEQLKKSDDLNEVLLEAVESLVHYLVARNEALQVLEAPLNEKVDFQPARLADYTELMENAAADRLHEGTGVSLELVSAADDEVLKQLKELQVVACSNVVQKVVLDVEEA